MSKLSLNINDTVYLSRDFCLSSVFFRISLKWMKKLIKQLWFIQLKNYLQRGECGIVAELVLEATWTGVRILQARCVSCRVSSAATHTAMPPVIFAPMLGYIRCPDVRVSAVGGLGSWFKIAIFFLTDDGQKLTNNRNRKPSQIFFVLFFPPNVQS